jgi:hypothetical protein
MVGSTRTKKNFSGKIGLSLKSSPGKTAFARWLNHTFSGITQADPAASFFGCCCGVANFNAMAV